MKIGYLIFLCFGTVVSVLFFSGAMIASINTFFLMAPNAQNCTITGCELLNQNKSCGSCYSLNITFENRFHTVQSCCLSSLSQFTCYSIWGIHYFNLDDIYNTRYICIEVATVLGTISTCLYYTMTIVGGIGCWKYRRE